MCRLPNKTLALLLGLMLTPLFIPASAQAAEKKSPATKTRPRVSQIHVIQGCTACETMLNWLRQGGVKFDTTRVQQGSYDLYPTVLYSDRTADHGDRLYAQKVQIPEKICLVVCQSGTE